MKNFKTIILLPIVLILSFACKGEGIFYTLRDEVAISNAGFADDADIRKILELSDGSLIALGNSLWIKSGNSGWNSLSIPSSLVSTTALTSAVVYQGNLLVSFHDRDSSYIFSYDRGASQWSNAIETGTQLPSSSSNYYLFVDENNDSNLFVNERGRGEGYIGPGKLYYFNTATLDFSTALVDNPGNTDDSEIILNPVQDVVFDGTNFLVLISDRSYSGDGKLYQAINLGSSPELSDVTPTELAAFDLGTAAIRTIDSQSLLLISAFQEDSSYVFSAASSSWSSDTWSSISLGSKRVESFSPMIDNLLIAGVYNSQNTNQEGYVELYLSNGELTQRGNTVALDNNLNSSELVNSIVLDWYLDWKDDSDITMGYYLYAAGSQGIWKLNKDNLTDPGEWTQE